MNSDSIGAVRKRHGITQAQLAKRLGLSEATLGKIERGTLPVTDEYASQILALVQQMIEEKSPCSAVA